MKKFIPALFLLMAVACINPVSGQCDTIANLCNRHIVPAFISDGQQYRSLLLNSEEYSEFNTTFFGETTYRIAACSGTNDGNLIFTIYDQDRNMLFTNKKTKNAPYWDFKVKATLSAIIEAKLDPAKNQGSGCAVILIGFKQP
jgi:hypothetical protein